MDMNQLLRAHQMTLMDQARAATRACKADHDDALQQLAERIRDLRVESRADTRGAWFVIGDPVPAYRDR